MTHEPTGPEGWRKFVPVTFTVRSGDPALALVGEIELIDGVTTSDRVGVGKGVVGATGVSGSAESAQPTSPGTKKQTTAMAKVMAEPRRVVISSSSFIVRTSARTTSVMEITAAAPAESQEFGSKTLTNFANGMSTCSTHPKPTVIEWRRAA
jgi:hypothetical protein